MYSVQMLGTVKEKSKGLLSLVPKDENGQPIMAVFIYNVDKVDKRDAGMKTGKTIQ